MPPGVVVVQGDGQRGRTVSWMVLPTWVDSGNGLDAVIADHDGSAAGHDLAHRSLTRWCTMPNVTDMTSVTTKYRKMAMGWHTPVQLVAAIAVSMLLLASCGGDSSSGSGDEISTVPTAAAGEDPLAPRPLAKRQTMVLGLTSKLEAYAQPLLAEELGEFDAENLDVDFAYVAAEDLQLLLQRGDLDAAAGTLNAGVLNLIAAGLRTKVVMPGVGLDPSSTQGFWINDKVVDRGDGELSVDDFRGKTLMAPAGTGGTYAAIFYDYVTSLPGGEDFQPTDLDVQSAPDSTTTVKALESGAIGVGKVNSPLDEELAATGCCTFLSGALPRESAVWFFGGTMSDRAEAGAAFVRAMARVTRDELGPGYRGDPEVTALLAEVLEVDQAALSKLPPLYFDPDFALAADDALGLQAYFRRVGLLTYDDDLTEADVFDERYLDAIRG